MATVCYCNLQSNNRYWCDCHSQAVTPKPGPTCTCNTVVQCTCNCNYACTCNCNNCSVNQNTSQTLPWTSATSSTGVTVGSLIDDTHLTQFYTAINAERSRRGQAGFSWSSYNVSGTITAAGWNEMVTKMNNWLTFTLSHNVGSNITSVNIITLRDRMIAIAAQCYCNCNRTCSCNTAVVCTCQTNRVCTCNTVCACNCNYGCTCNCQYRWQGTWYPGTGAFPRCTSHANICTCHTHTASDSKLKKNVEYM